VIRRVVFPMILILGLAETAAAIDIFVHAPRERQVLFGQVEIELEVLSAEQVAEVEIRLDGQVVSRLTEPPYRTHVDVGQENRAHVFEFTATDILGAKATRTLVSGMVEIHGEVDLELQQLYATVTRDGERVLDLDAESFEIRDDGRPQQRVTFERGDVPLTAALLIDASLSMKGDALRAALAGARSFVENMDDLDQAKVMVFSDRLLAHTPFTSDPTVVSAAVNAVTSSGSTAINDHLYLALKELDSRQGRRVIVLLSDGLDVDSILGMADVAWKVGRVQSVIYWIRPSSGADLSQDHASVWRDVAAQRQEIDALERTVSTSGGRVYEIAQIDKASEAFQEILRELREQYVLGYYPDNNRNDGAWHEVQVRVRSPGVRVRARGGYYDDEL
jgi:Ca-activated chloride channel family protein